MDTQNKPVKKAFKKSFYVILGVLVLLLFGLMLLWLNPKILVNEKTVSFFKDRFLPRNYELSWNDFAADIKGHGPSKIITISLDSPCLYQRVSKAPPNLVCFESVKTSFKLHLSLTGLNLERIYYLDMKEGNIYADQATLVKDRPQMETNTQNKLGPESIPEKLKAYPLERLLITFDEVQVITTKKQDLLFSGSIKGHSTENDLLLNVDLLPQRIPNLKLRSGKLELQISSDQGYQGPFMISSHIALKRLDGKVLDGNLKTQLSTNAPYLNQLEGHIHSDLDKWMAQIDLKARRDGEGIPLELVTSTVEIKGKKSLAGTQFKLGPCELDSEKRSVSGFTLLCPTKLVTPKSLRRKLPPNSPFGHTQGLLAISAENWDLDIKNRKVDGDFNVNFQTNESSPFQFSLQMGSDLSHRFDELLDREEVNAQLEVFLGLNDIQNLFELLAHFGKAPPAPFYSLQGPVQISSQTSLQELVSHLSLPLNLEANLYSTNQVLGLEGKGQWQIKDSSPHLALAIVAKEAKLMLPQLGLGPLPKLFPDKRIESSQARKKNTNNNANPSLSYEMRIKTQQDSPLYLISNLAQKPVPVNLDLLIQSGSPVTGSVQVNGFPIDLFRRDARLNYFNVSLEKKHSESDLNGLITVSYIDYLIRINILGTVSSPIINMESNPPLPEEDILSVLLFGRPLNDANYNQSSTVANLKTALSDQALNLASLYFFASTPIESIDYNPATESYSMKLRLSQKTSLTVGTDLSEEDRYEIRRRLGRGFSINTELIRNRETESSLISTFLEWNRRY